MNSGMVVQGLLNELCQVRAEYTCFMCGSARPIESDCRILSQRNAS